MAARTVPAAARPARSLWPPGVGKNQELEKAMCCSVLVRCRAASYLVHRLLDPVIKFWSLWDDDQLMGAGALKFLDKEHGEFKSIRVNDKFRNKKNGMVKMFKGVKKWP